MKGLIAVLAFGFVLAAATGACSSSSVNPTGGGGTGGASGATSGGGGSGTGGNSPCFDTCDGTSGKTQYAVIAHNCVCGGDTKCASFCAEFCLGKAPLDQNCVACAEVNATSCMTQCTGGCSNYRACVTACL